MKTTKKYRVAKTTYLGGRPTKIETFNLVRETKNYLFIFNDVREHQWTEKKFKDESYFKYFDSFPDALEYLLEYAEHAVKKAKENLVGSVRNLEKIKNEYSIKEASI